MKHFILWRKSYIFLMDYFVINLTVCRISTMLKKQHKISHFIFLQHTQKDFLH